MAENKQEEYLLTLVSLLPDSPGVYQYFDKSEKIIYVGKAKNLKKRVASYFNRKQDTFKTSILVGKIHDIKHIVVETETDALLLENNLIKKLQPKYNVLLKDDKSYPWICIKNEPFPRVFSTRNLLRDGSIYFGPYTSGRLVRSMLALFKSLYKFRTCKHNLSQENIVGNKFKVCLEFHIKNCNAPCVGAQTNENYDDGIDQIKKILRGKIGVVISLWREKMGKFAAEFRFEEAQDMKERINLLSNYQQKSTVVSPKVTNVDVFGIRSDEKYGYINFLRVKDGAIVQATTFEMRKKLEETDNELLSYAIADIRGRFDNSPDTIITAVEPDFVPEDTHIIIPKIGDKKHLLDLSEQNAKRFRFERIKRLEKTNPERHQERILATMKADLRLHETPIHIECFDNSNLQGSNPVAACVVFRNAKPSKKEYRHFNIKTVEGIDDFASMREVIYRRYKRLIEEKESLPQLVIVDGGKGQLSAALSALDDLGARGKIAIIGIAKRLEEIFYPDDPVPLYLDKNSESLKVIQFLRNEAHRFGITFHRDKRSKGMITSELDAIKGVGEKSAYCTPLVLELPKLL